MNGDIQCDAPREDKTLCIIFEAIGPFSAIARVAMQDVLIALDAGWKVTVVAKFLHETLRDRVEWLPLHVPQKVFLYQWVTARYYIKKALGNRKFDVIHAHQPQSADFADIFQCHYLTRAAFERNSLTRVRNLHAAIIRAQEQCVLYVEDYFYRHWNPATHMLYDSELTRLDFHRTYGVLNQEEVLTYAFPKIDFPTERERRLARSKAIGCEPSGLVVGYLGGIHERKGYRRLIKAVASDEGTFLMLAGQYTEDFEVPELNGRIKSVGLVLDLRQFYFACDVLVIPSLYEPLGLVAFEAAAHGLPVIATEEVGALPHLLEYGAGTPWNPTESITTVVKDAVAMREQCNQGAIRMEQDLGAASYGRRLLSLYDIVRSEKRGETVAPPIPK